jgi:hypothetical protein
VPVPQLPQLTGFVWVGAHTPVQVAVPLDTTHVWFVHVAGVPHTAVALHVETPLLVHCVVPGLHATHAAFEFTIRHTGAAPAQGDEVVFVHAVPIGLQSCGCAPAQPGAPGSQAVQMLVQGASDPSLRHESRPVVQ